MQSKMKKKGAWIEHFGPEGQSNVPLVMSYVAVAISLSSRSSTCRRDEFRRAAVHTLWVLSTLTMS